MSMSAEELRNKIAEIQRKILDDRESLGERWSSGDAVERNMQMPQIQQSIYYKEMRLNELERQLNELSKPRASVDRHIGDRFLAQNSGAKVVIDLTEQKEVIDLTDDDSVNESSFRL